jgi:hypothetical protein
MSLVVDIIQVVTTVGNFWLGFAAPGVCTTVRAVAEFLACNERRRKGDRTLQNSLAQASSF